MVDIVQYPHKLLTTPCNEVKNFAKAAEVADRLIEVIKKLDKPLVFGLGMAAPQIGHPSRVIVLKKGYGKYSVMINPEKVRQKWMIIAPSRCYSLKGTYLVKSPLWIKVKYSDLEGNSHTEIVTGSKAVTLHQEIDHLNGKLLHDRGIRIF